MSKKESNPVPPPIESKPPPPPVPPRKKKPFGSFAESLSHGKAYLRQYPKSMPQEQERKQILIQWKWDFQIILGQEEGQAYEKEIEKLYSKDTGFVDEFTFIKIARDLILKGYRANQSIFNLRKMLFFLKETKGLGPKDLNELWQTIRSFI